MNEQMNESKQTHISLVIDVTLTTRSFIDANEWKEKRAIA